MQVASLQDKQDANAEDGNQKEEEAEKENHENQESLENKENKNENRQDKQTKKEKPDKHKPTKAEKMAKQVMDWVSADITCLDHSWSNQISSHGKANEDSVRQLHLYFVYMITPSIEQRNRRYA